MTPSRAHAAAEPEEKRDTIPAPPPSAAVLDEESPVESRVSSRRRDTVPAPADVPAFEEEPATDRSPQPVDTV